MSTSEPRYNRAAVLSSISPVLVLGRVPRIIFAIARSLHNYGIPVDVADFTSGPALHSRAIRSFLRLPDPELSSADFVPCLSKVVAKHGHDMLIPADDEALAAITEYYDELKELTSPACPPPAITRLVLNKVSTLEAARQCEIAVPKTILVSNSAQLLGLARTFPFPWILKPSSKRQSPAEIKTCFLRSADEVAKRFPTVTEFAQPMLLQECCPGAGIGVEILLHGGECQAVFQHRRLKEFPYNGGVAVLAISEAPDAGLVKSSLSLLRVLGWTEGVVMVEYKVNPADGKAVLMEVNGRYWGSVSLPILCGLDFPLYHWKLAHGEPLAVPSTYEVGRRWRWTGGLFRRLHSLMRAARREPGVRKILFSDVRSLIGDFAHTTEDPLLTIADPLPALLDLRTTTTDLLAILTDDVSTFLRSRVFHASPG